MWAFLSPLIMPILNLFGGTLIDAYKTKLTAENTKEKIEAELAAKSIALSAREAELATQIKVATIGRWYEPEHLFAFIMVFYIGKVMIYDAALGLGSTDPVKGAVGEWAGMIMMFWMGSRGVQSVARILKG